MTRPIETTVTELAPGGEGVAIAEVDGERRAVFVPGVAPGERIRVEADFSRRPARGRLLAVLEPSASRITPPCPHHGACGGCDAMHLDADAQRRAHAHVVEKILPKPFAGVSVVAHAAPKTERYRVRARFHVEAKRGGVVAGFLGRRSRELVRVSTCLVLDPVVDGARAQVEELLAGASGRGEANVAIGEGRLPVVDLRWSGDLPAETFARTERAIAQRAIAGARIFAGDVRVPAVIGDPTPVIAGADGEPLRLAPGGFSQASEEGNVLLASRVRELARSAPSGPCLELYAGAGNLTVLLARDREVVAVEADREACAAARANLAARGLRAKIVEADAAETILPRNVKLVVLDPPRTGARRVAERLAESRVPSVVYVSCDPPTLGRDLATLAQGGYELSSIETFEMFPQTSHVETIAALRRA